MASKYALERAAQAWCTDKTSSIVMDPILAEAFADILDAEREELDRLRVQLAGCSTAALGYISNPAKLDEYEYGWSPAYEDVLTLRVKYEKLINKVKE